MLHFSEVSETVNFSKSSSSRASRNAKRVPLQISLTVTGRDEYGTAFVDLVRTENVSIEGGCLLFSRDLRRNQSLRIEGQNGARFFARVRWCMYYFRQDTRRVGFQLDAESKKSWILSNRDV
jgi:hypothetical protein